MPRKQFRTNRRVWLLLSSAIFVALGFVDPWKGAGKGDNDWWSHASHFPSYNKSQWIEMLPPFVVYGLMLVVAAVILGWVFQAIFLVLTTRVRASSSDLQSAKTT